MKLYQVIAVFIVLLHVGSCALNCSYPVRCREIINVYEQALIEQKGNIFILNDLFYPSNEAPVDSILVRYTLLTNSSQGEHFGFIRLRGWCKTNVYTIVSPLMLETLFTGLVYLYNSKFSRSTEIRNKIIEEDYKELALNLTQHNEFSDTQTKIYNALNYITPWVSVHTLIIAAA